MIFNVSKTAEQYEDVKLFGNGDVGLLDTVNKKFTKIFDLYKEMKQLVNSNPGIESRVKYYLWFGDYTMGDYQKMFLARFVVN